MLGLCVMPLWTVFSYGLIAYACRLEISSRQQVYIMVYRKVPRFDVS
jgi:hypothetical protein